jgi:hypothetical protein
MTRLTRGFLIAGLLLSFGCSDAKQARPQGGLASEAPAAREKGGDKPAPRKIIYTANVDLVVDDFDGAVEQLRKLAADHDAYVAKSDLRGTPGAPRSGSWTVRVPVKRFEDFVRAVSRLGELQRNSLDSEDITDRYYDLEAHIKTDEAEEAALRKLLEQAANTDSLLAIRKELREVRGKIEQQKGQLQRWSKETELATVHVSLLDRKAYKPPVVPKFTSTAGRIFSDSLDAIVTLVQMLALAVVALAPWLLVGGVLALAFRTAWKRRRRRRGPAVAPAPAGAGGAAPPPLA